MRLDGLPCFLRGRGSFVGQFLVFIDRGTCAQLARSPGIARPFWGARALVAGGGAAPSSLAVGFTLCRSASIRLIDVRRRALLRRLDLFALLLLAQQVLEGVFVFILELLRLEMSGLGLDDMDGEIDHVLRDFLVLDGVEIVLFLAHLVRVAQRDAHHALAARLKRNGVLARGEHHLAQRHHAFLADGFADHGEGLLSDLAVRNDVIGIAHIEFVDFAARHEFLDLDDVLALQRYGFEFFRLKLDIFALRDLVALYDIGVLDFVAGFASTFL